MKGKWIFTVTLCLVFWVFNSCDPGDSTDPEPQNPVPVLTTLTPAETISHLPAFTLKATGNHFITTSVIVFNGVEMATQFINSTELSCTVNPDDTAVVAGTSCMNRFSSADATCPVLVRNPAPGGGDSAPLDFLVRNTHTFSDPLVVSAIAASATCPQLLLAENGSLHLVCIQSSATAHARSNNDGANWTSAGTFSFPAYKLHKHALVNDNDGNLIVIWTDFTGVRFSRSTDQGNTWSSPAVICYGDDICQGCNMNLATAGVDDDGRIFAAWSMYYTFNHNEIYFSRSLDDGVNWSAPINLSHNDTMINNLMPDYYGTIRSEGPCMAVDHENLLHVAWHFTAYDYDDPEDWYTHLSHVYHIRSDDGGISWGSPQYRSSNQKYAYYPHLDIGTSGDFGISWHSQNTGATLGPILSYPCYFGDEATSQQPLEVAPDMEDTFYLDHQVDAAGNINVVWGDEGSGGFEIYFARSIDGGLNWTVPQNVSNAPGSSERPVLACDRAGYLYLAWQDNESGKWRIRFATSKP